MPIVPSPAHGGWVRLPPPRRNRSPAKQAEALRSGPLAYFACTPAPAAKPSKLPPCPKYDLDDPEPLPKSRKKNMGGRVVSAPVRHRDEEFGDDSEGKEEEEEGTEEEPIYINRRPKHGHAHSHHHNSDVGRRTVSAMPRAPAATGRGGSSRRHDDHGGQEQSKYWTGPSNRSSVTGSSSVGSRSSYARSNASRNSRWDSATQALDI